MILSDREIKLALRRDFLRITPPPSDGAISSTSVDLTLHEQISVWLPHPQEMVAPVVVHPARPTFDEVPLLREHGATLLLPAAGFILKPGALVLGWTEERIRLPLTSRLAARVEGRSSLARLGVGVHVTAPTIHAGFGSLDDPQHVGTRIRLEIWNCGPLHVCLEKGMKICQLILEEVHGTPEKGYEGTFATQAPEGVPPAPPTSASKPRKRRR
ncbi:MAG TPA: dCTP deaminase [Gemmataceae bacterium]|nr:dCTP deaminase [Gemmataceae bacterium]